MSTVQVIKPETILSVEISGYMLQKLQGNLLSFYNALPAEKQKALQEILSDEKRILEDQDETLDIAVNLMAIITAAEEYAREKGLIVEEEFIIPDPELENSDLKQNPSTVEQS
jgi:hypothetical protein